MYRKVCFFLLAAMLGILLVSSVVYSEYEYDQEEYFLTDSDVPEDTCPDWLTNLAMIS